MALLLYLSILYISLFLIILGGSFFAYLKTFYFPKGHKAIPFTARNEREEEILKSLFSSREILKSQGYEGVFTTSHDNLTLFGRYYHVKSGAPLFIEFHGYKGEALRDFCACDMVFKSLGCNTLLVDQRAHGKSGGKTISFGVNERLDCLAWVKWANKRFGDIPIFLAGISMGGATVLTAASLSLPKNVRGIISDCAFSSPKEIICKVLSDRHLPKKIFYPLVYLGAFLFGGFYLNASSAILAVKNARVPILLLHGKADSFVPHQMSEEIYKSCSSEREIFTFEGAGHGFSFATDAPKYEHAVKDFFLSHLN